jgi:hypothetical protein
MREREGLAGSEKWASGLSRGSFRPTTLPLRPLLRSILRTEKKCRAYGEGNRSDLDRLRRVSIMNVNGSRTALVFLLERMDKAFGVFSLEAEKLSVLLAATRDPSSWTSYHELLRQKTAELVAYERYRKIQEELFATIGAPEPQARPESSVS